MTTHASTATPFGAELWKTIEEAAISSARDLLSARRILNVEGPHGLGLTTVETGQEESSPSQSKNGATALVSRLLPVPLIYQPFVLSTRLIAATTDMHQPLNTKPVEDAAQAVAVREEEFIYNGQPDLQLPGLLTVNGRNTQTGGDWSNLDRVLDDLIAAVNILDGKGYRGPYGLTLAPTLYNNCSDIIPAPSSCRSNTSSACVREGSSKPRFSAACWWPPMSALSCSGRT